MFPVKQPSAVYRLNCIQPLQHSRCYNHHPVYIKELCIYVFKHYILGEE